MTSAVRTRALALIGLVLAAGLGAVTEEPVVHDARALVDGVLELATCDWTRDGARVTWEQDGDIVPLASIERGTRWTTVFSTAEGYQARLDLRHVGGPDGFLFEVLLDGQTLTPVRDAWRPTRRPLASDLGSVWLGPGRHLIEFIAREQAVGALHLGQLRVRRLGSVPEPPGEGDVEGAEAQEPVEDDDSDDADASGDAEDTEGR